MVVGRRWLRDLVPPYPKSRRSPSRNLLSPKGLEPQEREGPAALSRRIHMQVKLLAALRKGNFG